MPPYGSTGPLAQAVRPRPPMISGRRPSHGSRAGMSVNEGTPPFEGAAEGRECCLRIEELFCAAGSEVFCPGGRLQCEVALCRTRRLGGNGRCYRLRAVLHRERGPLPSFSRGLF